MLEIGQVVGGKYKIIHKAGKGGMSDVYLAINEDVNREWAVKEVHKEKTLDPRYGGDGETKVKQTVRKDVSNESQIMSRLKNQHLPRITEVLETESSYLIVMDYIEGKTLKKELIDSGPLPQEDVVDIAMQMCDALGYLHGLTPQIIYRDMKPDNIMRKPDGTCILIDFGISREYKEEEKDSDTTCLGTRGYAPPEQYADAGLGQTDPRSDIYALGATMYHLVTGKDPSRKPYEMRPIRKWNPALSSGLEAIIIKCTQNDPEKRYQDVQQLMTALLHYRELDQEYQKLKNGQVKQCAAILVMGLLCLFGGIAAGLRARSMKAGNYQSLIQAAETAITREERVEGYRQAVAADPVKEDAYEGLLSEYLLDGDFSQDEAEEMAKILGYKGKDDTEAAEEQFRKGNPRAYDEFCYRYGLAFFYYYGPEGNKPLSRPWLRTAKDSSSLDKKKRERAERFYGIADYYMLLDQRDKAGDNAVSYEKYWVDLVMLASGDIIQEDNIQTALVVYEDLAYQIAVHAADFKNAGVGFEDMSSELDMIRGRLEKEAAASPQYEDEGVQAMAASVMKNADKAQKALEAVFQGKEEKDE